jgi:hypothetical protein
MVENCSGLRGSLSDITWYEVPGVETFDHDGETVSGYWAGHSNTIVLAGNGKLDGLLVRHEMLHALVNKKGHPRSDFLQKCGGVVYCTEKCVEDAGPAPAVSSSVPRVSPDVLKLALTIIPETPSSSTDGGMFTIAVTATNPNPYAIVITPNPTWTGDSFDYNFFTASGNGTSGGIRLPDPGRLYFEAGETRKQYFDFRIATRFTKATIPPGSYTIRGMFAGRSAKLESVVIGP